MFDPGSEVVTYRTPEECVEVIDYYLEHTAERETIAGNGQQRTYGNIPNRIGWRN